MSDKNKGIPADDLPFVRLVIATHLMSSSSIHDLMRPEIEPAVDHAYYLADLLIAKAGL